MSDPHVVEPCLSPLSFPADLQNGESFLRHGIGVLPTGRLGHRTRQDPNPCTLPLLWDLKSDPNSSVSCESGSSALRRILQELSQMYRTLHFWEKAGTVAGTVAVFVGGELRIQSDLLPC